MFGNQAKITPHEVGMSLAGKPKWWTVDTGNQKLEVVRVHYDTPNADILFYVVMPQGIYAWPPLVAPSFKLGPQAWDKLEADGGRFFPYETELGKKFELLFNGSKH